MTHTPFPWRLEINDKQTEGNIYGPNDEHVSNADLGGAFLIGGKAELERDVADLYLKAAIPAMLEALIAVQARFQNLRLTQVHIAILDQVDAAIKAAKP